jgi:hypothetical protein
VGLRGDEREAPSETQATNVRLSQWPVLVGVIVVAVVVIGFVLSQGDEPGTGAASVQGPVEFAAYDGLANFCERFESFLLVHDNSDAPPNSTDDLRRTRLAWLQIGFPDEMVGEARSVDDQFEMLVTESEGVDLSTPSGFEAWAADLEADPATQETIAIGNFAYEDIRSFAIENCI